MPLSDYIEDFTNHTTVPNSGTTSDLCGVHHCDSKRGQYGVLAGQFTNLFLFPGLKEQSITRFLKGNPSFLESAFSSKSSIYHPKLDWIEGNDQSKDKAIIPDVLLQRPDGYWDICDFKTARLDKTNITKGGHRRRRFIDCVHEGIAQLANYDEYFKHRLNQDHARLRHGVAVSDPTLYLVVGNYENTVTDEVREAARSLGPNYRIVDFDTLVALYLGSQS